MITLLLIAVAILFATNSDAELSSRGSPKYQRVTVGKNALFVCYFIGSNSANFSWTGPALTDLGERVRIVSNSYLSRLEIDDVHVMDAGMYTCSHGSASTDLTFNLTVWEIPQFNPEMQTEYTVSEGEDVIIPCRVNKCYARQPHCQVFWLMNDTRHVQSVHVRDEQGTTSVLSLQNVQHKDTGLYTCGFRTASSPYNSVSFHVVVVPVKHRKPILDKSIEYSYREFNYPEPLVLHCPLRSGENTTYNPLIVSWTFTNEFNQPQRELGDELRIDEHYTRGIYKCMATNSLGSDSLSIFVEINAPPLPAAVELPTVTLLEGNRRAVLKSSQPTSPIALHTLRHMWEMFQGDHWVLATSNDRFHVTHKGHLRIMNVTMSDAGLYRVNVSNSFGHSVQTKQVNVHPLTPGSGMNSI